MRIYMNRLNDLSLVIIGAIVGTCVLVGVVSRFFMPDDNPIEEIAEEVIKEYTGVEVDLSPESPEDNKNVKQ